MFGSRKQDILYFSGKTLAASVDELLTPSAPLPAPPVKTYVNDSIPAGDPELNIAVGQTWVDTHTTDGTAQSRRRASLKSWWMGLLMNQDRSIREKMVLFWHNHFSTETNDVSNARYAYRHVDLLRKQALGNFKSLVREITLDPAMLVYLNGQLNTKAAPDENYARELQELFTLGKENNPNYTEDDVKIAARVLTGWRNDAPNNKSYFDLTRHDTANKTFSSFYNNTTITGRNTADAGTLELDDLLNMIFAKKAEVSGFLVRKLYRWFVYYEITPAVENNIIKPLAQLLVDSNWELKPVLQDLLMSQHFFDVANSGCQIKSPLDLAAGLAREYNVVFPDSATDVVSQYNHWNNFRNLASNMQQNLGDPPDVSGWKAYYQAPGFYEIWINSDTYPKRNQFTDQMVGNGYTFNSKKAVIDAVGFAKTLTSPHDPNLLISETIEILYRVTLSQATRDQLKKDILLSGQTSDHYWTDAWTAYMAAPTNMALYNVVNDRLKALLKYLMNLPEYHLI
jgi:uncharacterized protein (DUF1800 family)